MKWMEEIGQTRRHFLVCVKLLKSIMRAYQVVLRPIGFDVGNAFFWNEICGIRLIENVARVGFQNKNT